MNPEDMTKEDIVNDLTGEEKPKKPNRNLVGRTIKLKFNPFVDVPLGKRRCGECGKIFPLQEFKQQPVGYYYKCKECRKYEKVLK